MFPRHEAAEVGSADLRWGHSGADGLFVLDGGETACEFHRCAGGEHEVGGGGEFYVGLGEVVVGEVSLEAAEADDEALDVDEE